MTVSSIVRLSIIKALSIRSPSRPPFTWRKPPTRAVAVSAEPTSKRLSQRSLAHWTRRCRRPALHFRRLATGARRAADVDTGNRVTFTHRRRLHYISSVDRPAAASPCHPAGRRLGTAVIKNDVKRTLGRTYERRTNPTTHNRHRHRERHGGAHAERREGRRKASSYLQ